MATIQVTEETHRLLMQRKLDTRAKSLDAVIHEAFEPTPRKRAVVRRLQELRGPLSDMGVRRVHLFGSVVHDAATPGSDVDLIIEMEDDRSLFDLAGIRLFLDAALGLKTDIVTPAGLHPRLKDGIWAEAEAVW